MASPFVIPYKRITPGDMARPYLWMRVTGVNGQTRPVVGLVDSGADTTAFPLPFAAVLGYTPATLVSENSGTASGAAASFRATQLSSIFVPENPDLKIDILPGFLPGMQIVLWGRTDFMAAYDVTLMESQQQFLIRPVGP